MLTIHSKHVPDQHLMVCTAAAGTDLKWLHYHACWLPQKVLELPT